MNIKLPDEDVKTVDVDVKSEKVTFGLKASLNHSFLNRYFSFHTDTSAKPSGAEK